MTKLTEKEKGTNPARKYKLDLLDDEVFDRTMRHITVDTLKELFQKKPPERKDTVKEDWSMVRTEAPQKLWPEETHLSVGKKAALLAVIPQCAQRIHSSGAVIGQTTGLAQGGSNSPQVFSTVVALAVAAAEKRFNEQSVIQMLPTVYVDDVALQFRCKDGENIERKDVYHLVRWGVQLVIDNLKTLGLKVSEDDDKKGM